MRYVGIDPSLTRTGLYILNGDAPLCYSIKSKQSDSDYDRQVSIVSQIYSKIEVHDLICFEDFGSAGQFQISGKFKERLELFGMLKFCLRQRTKLPFLVCMPQRLKQFLGGKVSVDKPAMLEAARKLDPKISNHDEADAFGLARIAMYAHRKDFDAGSKKKKDVIAQVRDYKTNSHTLYVAKSVCLN